MLQVKPARTKSFRQTHKPILLVVNSRLLNLFYCVLWLACNSSGVVSVSLKELSRATTTFAIETVTILGRTGSFSIQQLNLVASVHSRNVLQKKFVLPVTHPPNRMCSSTDHRVSVAGEPVEAFGHPQGRSTYILHWNMHIVKAAITHMSSGRTMTLHLDLQRHGRGKPWPSPRRQSELGHVAQGG